MIGMKESCLALKKRYEGAGLAINECTLVRDEAACFPFINGISLAELMDSCLEQDDIEGFLAYFREFVKKIGYGQESPVTNMDPVFSNILIREDQWNLIDYEWTFPKQVDGKELAYRALYCYLLEDKKREKLPFQKILEELGITEEAAARYREKEAVFQQFVTANNHSMAQLRDDIGYQIIQPLKWIDRYQDSAGVNRVQIYEDRGAGYQEETSYFVPDAYQGENHIEFLLKVPGEVRNLRLDPSMDACVVKVAELTWNGLRVNMNHKRLVVVNGRRIAAKGTMLPTIVFPTTDPNINIRLDRLNRLPDNQLYVKLEIVRIPMAMAQDMALKNRR